MSEHGTPSGTATYWAIEAASGADQPGVGYSPDLERLAGISTVVSGDALHDMQQRGFPVRIIAGPCATRAEADTRLDDWWEDYRGE